MRSRPRALLALSLLLGTAAFAAPGPADGEAFTPDGAWCWFSDPRALVADGRIVAGWVHSDGSIQVGSRPLRGDATTVVTLAPQFERDDHDNPAFAVLPDGRLAAFFSKHSKGDMFFATTRRAGEHTQWTEPRPLGFLDPARGPRGITYANPFVLTAEDNALWVFWRGSDFKPTFSVSRDGGETWSAQRTLISEHGRDTGNRPYVKYWSDGKGRIDLIFTDGHPRNEAANSLYFVRYERGAFWRADGTKIATLDELPLQPSQCDRVYDGRTAGRAWIWSVVEDPQGHPVIGYTRLPSERDHRYHYARWDGSRWVDHEIAPAGGWFPQTPEGEKEREPHYSGGLSLDPANPARLYLSRPVEGAFEIEEWTTADGGARWTQRALTHAPGGPDNVRPYALPGAPAGTAIVLWMHNHRYVHYTNYRTALQFLHRPAQP
ncbi:MAG TPA: BNR-4 repeat-containing protein [Opitutaceae bacterium]|nr:BNR-4 repeat-containing protein [Opitutaceae bacterium]